VHCKLIGIVDYGLGNISAFENILNSFNKKFRIIKKTADFKKISKIILPGVGSFDKANELLEKNNFIDTLNEKVIINKTPILGVCVGMQIMAETSEEGQSKGFSWINANVKLLKTNNKLPVPHMGWNEIVLNEEIDIFKNIDDLKFYFLHSYYFSNSINLKNTALTNYGVKFISAFNHENIYGIQFHPEKSHKSGIQLLENFCNL